MYMGLHLQLRTRPSSSAPSERTCSGQEISPMCGLPDGSGTLLRCLMYTPVKLSVGILGTIIPQGSLPEHSLTQYKEQEKHQSGFIPIKDLNMSREHIQMCSKATASLLPTVPSQARGRMDSRNPSTQTLNWNL